MGTSRLQNRDRLFIRLANDGTAIANSALWRKTIPRGQGRWKDITSCVVGCCGTEIPTEGSYIIFTGASPLDGDSALTAISFPGYSWTGSIGQGDVMVVPLPYDFNETITLTVSVTAVDMDINTSTILGTGVIAPGFTLVSTDADPQTVELTVTSAPGSQYVVSLTDD